jgi:hypothetical protein
LVSAAASFFDAGRLRKISRFATSPFGDSNFARLRGHGGAASGVLVGNLRCSAKVFIQPKYHSTVKLVLHPDAFAVGRCPQLVRDDETRTMRPEPESVCCQAEAIECLGLVSSFGNPVSLGRFPARRHQGTPHPSCMGMFGCLPRSIFLQLPSRRPERSGVKASTVHSESCPSFGVRVLAGKSAACHS